MSFTDGTQSTLKSGNILGFDAKIEHNVIAKELTKVIVTIIF